MKTFQAVFNEEEVDGVFGISLVHDPATKSHFIALKNQEPKPIQFASIDEKQFILAGLVLEPDVDIYRYDKKTNEEYTIRFDSNTVKNLCYAFTKNKHNSNSTEEHNQKSKIEGISFVENWVVRDPKTDTSLSLGLNPKKGSWMTVAKCDNKEVYERALSGEFLGFSIDAMVSLKEVNLKSNINMSEFKEALVSFKDDILEALNLKKDEEKEEVKIEMGSVKSADGQILFEYDGETPEVGGSVWVVSADKAGEEMRVPIPVGEYELEGGAKLVVTEEGLIASMDAVTEEVKPEEKAEMDAETTPNTGGQDANSVINQVQESIKSIMIKYKEDIDLRFDALAKENKELKAEVLELSKQPAAKQIKSQVTQVPLNANGRLLSKIRQ